MNGTIEKRVAFIGLGKMGSILLKALLANKILSGKNVTATVRQKENADSLSRNLGISVTTDNPSAVSNADLIMICVKPNSVAEVMREIQTELASDKVLISIAASVTTRYIEDLAGLEIPVIRAMPNTPCSVGLGMTGICKGRYAEESHVNVTEAFFTTIGLTVAVDETHMDAVTGLSASGPAFIYVILEALAEGGVKMGLSRKVATLLAAQTVQGAARVALETGNHPALLKDEVTTPAGCTIDGIIELEDGKLRATLIKAVVKAVERAKELLLVD